jgi:long-subunit fatty acid transport protein
MKKGSGKNAAILSLMVCMVYFIGFTGITAAADLIQRIEIPSSPNPVGSGARALGMGGAFIAVADDATAASWNPGGLIQLELPEISIVGAAFHRAEDISFGKSPGTEGEETVSKADLNYMSAAYPFTLWNRNMIVSLNYQNLYDFTREWTFTLTDPAGGLSQYVDYQAEGDLSAMGLAYCIQITPAVSFGLTLNFWDDGLSGNEWEDRRYQRGTGVDNGEPFQFESYTVDKYSFRGFNANAGVLWNVNAHLTLGAVFKTPFEASLSHDHSLSTVIQYPNLPGFGGKTENVFHENADLDMPMSYGIGAAYRFSKELTASLDIYRTEWDDFILTDAAGNEISPITGLSPGESDIDPTHQIRMGAEYLFILPEYVVPVRGGLFYDPAPAKGSPDDFYGFSLGSGIGYGNIIFDIAYQYRFGNDVGESILQHLEFSQDVSEHTVYSSVIIHF